MLLKLSVERLYLSLKQKTTPFSDGLKDNKLSFVLFQDQQSLRLNEIPRLKSVEVHTARKIRTIELHFVDSRISLLIHQHRHLTTEDVIDF